MLPCYHVGGLFLVQQKVWLRAEDVKCWGQLIGLNHVLQSTGGDLILDSWALYLVVVGIHILYPSCLMRFSLTSVYVPPCGFEAGQLSSVNTVSISKL